MRFFHSLPMLCSFRDQSGCLTRSLTAALDKGRGLAVPAKAWALYPTPEYAWPNTGHRDLGLDAGGVHRREQPWAS